MAANPPATARTTLPTLPRSTFAPPVNATAAGPVAEGLGWAAITVALLLLLLLLLGTTGCCEIGVEGAEAVVEEEEEKKVEGLVLMVLVAEEERAEGAGLELVDGLVDACWPGWKLGGRVMPLRVAHVVGSSP